MRGFSRTVVIALVVLVATSLGALQILQVNGPIYHRIVLGKDLVADILPPPEYVLEAYLETTLALRDPAQAKAHLEHLKSLESDYRDRHDYWSKSGLPANVKQMIVVGSDEPAEQFWREVDDRFTPALQRGDLVAAQASYGALSAQYATHRAAIDRLVTAANADDDKIERLTVAAMVAFAGLMLALSAVLIFIVRRRAAGIVKTVVDPLADISKAMAELSAGDLALSIPHTDRGDEVGDMARALTVFRDQALEAETLRAQQARSQTAQIAEDRRLAAEQSTVVDALGAALSRLAGGDLAIRIETPFSGAYERLRQDFNGAAGQLDQALVLVRDNADGMRQRVEDIAAAHQSLASRTIAQARNVEQTARTLQGIAEAVRASARSTAQASEAVLAAKIEAERSDGVINDTVSAMSQIVTSTQQISTIVEVIDGIAFQTNLLALNAGVEAARAGDSGRGFAVVATEVRALAQHTAERAKAINQLVRGSKSLVDNGMNYVTDTGETLRRIVVQVGDLAEFVGAIAEATQEQAGRLGAVNVASSELESATQQNARMAEDCHESVAILQGQAEALCDIVARFSVSALTDAGLAEDASAGTSRSVGADHRQDMKTHAHVLIVDDNAVNRTVAAKMCEMFGCTSEQVNDGETAVRAAQSGRYDIILMDIMMPGMGGAEAIRAIRRLSGAAGQTPIIAVTANALDRTVADTRAAGVTGIVEKPISPKGLFDAINAALTGARGGRARQPSAA